MISFANLSRAARRPGASAVRSIIALVGALAAGSAVAGTVCPAQPAAATLHLPHFQAALVSGSEGLIVALGSSSTEGVMASDIAHSYPAVLQSVLDGELQAAHVAVINRGIGGQDAAEELARLEVDVIAVRPQLVIWQVGANAALRNADPAAFDRMVTAGVKRLQTAGIDVILMDNQRSPRILASGDHVAVEAALASIAKETGVDLFSRGGLMDAWNEHGAPPAQFIASDGMHHNDRGYNCMARALAERIIASVNRRITVSASR
jgi:acyl-CoA thioesterase-1